MSFTLNLECDNSPQICATTPGFYGFFHALLTAKPSKHINPEAGNREAKDHEEDAARSESRTGRMRYRAGNSGNGAIVFS
jgi:hypothetical protein